MKRIIILALVMVGLSACATITRGTTTAFTVETTPAGASVKLSNGMSCDYTPCSFEVKRKPGFVATIEKEGFETATVNIISSVASGGGAAMAGNVLLGGIIGAGVDASTGAMNNLSPNPLVIELVPLTSEAAPAEKMPMEEAAPEMETGS